MIDVSKMTKKELDLVKSEIEKEERLRESNTTLKCDKCSAHVSYRNRAFLRIKHDIWNGTTSYSEYSICSCGFVQDVRQELNETKWKLSRNAKCVTTI